MKKSCNFDTNCALVLLELSKISICALAIVFLLNLALQDTPIAFAFISPLVQHCELLAYLVLNKTLTAEKLQKI